MGFEDFNSFGQRRTAPPSSWAQTLLEAGAMLALAAFFVGLTLAFTGRIPW